MITVYTSPTCVYCNSAKQLLEDRGLVYKEIRLGEDVTRDQFLALYPHIQTVPAIFVNGTYIGGFSQLTEWVANSGKQFLIES